MSDPPETQWTKALTRMSHTEKLTRRVAEGPVRAGCTDGADCYTYFTCVGSLEDLFVLRALMGLAMAVSAPAAYSLIAEITPPNRLATATSIYSGTHSNTYD